MMESDENIGKYFLEYWAENASMRAEYSIEIKRKRYRPESTIDTTTLENCKSNWT